MIYRIFMVLLVLTLWMRADAQNIQNRQTVVQQPGDADANINVGTTNVWTSVALTTTRTWTMPAASAVGKGATVTITDLIGAISTPGQNILLDGNGSDTINGRNFYIVGQSYGSVVLTSNGSNGWAASAEASDVSNATFATAFNQLGVSQGPLALIKLAPLPPGSPGAGVGWIALTKGTNAGTCKLVALAGLSSTATTILDNIGGGGLSQGGC